MKLYQKLALAGAVILSGITGACRQKIDSPRENSKPSLETVIITEKPRITLANEELRKFPNSFGKYGEVRKYKTPGAKYSMAHIKQSHYRPPTFMKNNPKLTKEQNNQLRELYKNEYDRIFRKINSIQKGIYAVLRFLNQKGYKEIRAEGATIPLTEKQCLNEYNSTMSEILTLFGKTKEENKPYFFVPGADVIQGALGQIKLFPADKKELLQKAEKNPKDKLYTYEARENALLEIIDESGKAFSIVVYGANHDFKDNIEKWNKKYPSKKFSLIEVTPKPVD